MRVLIINGSYRENGVTDTMLAAAAAELRRHGAEIDEVVLREHRLSFCTNCRSCMQAPGETPGHCVLDDDMAAIIGRIEAADAYILASPVNFGSVTAGFKQFMERLAVYAYWPEGDPAPTYRKAECEPKKKALVVSSSAAPGPLGRVVFSSLRQLRSTAKLFGAKTVGTLFTGFADRAHQHGLPERQAAKLARQVEKLAA